MKNDNFTAQAGPSPAQIAFFWAALFLVLFGLRMAFADIPLDRDEGTYAYTAWRMGFGEMPYRDIFDHKQPGIYFIYRLAFMIFGTSVTAVRLFTAFYAALTCVILFVAARRDYGNRAAGIAAFLCAIFYGGVHFQAVNSNTEIFAALPLLLSYYFAGDKNIKKGSFLSGFFFAVSFFMKEIVFLFGALVLARLLIKKELRRAVPFFAAGILAVSAAVFAWLAANNLPAYYAECVISYNLFYSLKNAGGEPRVMAYFAAIHAPLTLGAVMMFTRKDPAEDGSWLLKACVIACAAGILAFGFRYRHYFIILIAPLSVAAGSVISGLISSELSRVKKGALLAVFAACFLPYAAYQAPLFGKNGGYLSVVQHESQVFYESALIAERINSAANDSTRLLVLRSNPEIYFLTRKKAATRYVNVTGPMRFFDGKIERELLDYSLKQRPEIIVAENDAKNRFAEALAGYNTVIAGESLEMLAREPRMRPQNSRF